jgi:hypothetical protein
MIVNVAANQAYVGGTDGVVWKEGFTGVEFFDLANQLEALNTPNNGGTPLRRLTDMCWALQNDSSACVVFNTEVD